MPNPLERRRTTNPSSGGGADEVAELKQQLKDLQEAYARDMANVSLDMRQLSLDLREAKSNAKTDPAA